MIKIKKTEAFLKKVFDESNYFLMHESEKNYRLEHSYRVANIAKIIARNEGMDVEGLIIAGLLHDISYSENFEHKDDWINHGRKSAQMARPFLEQLGMDANQIQEICYGIATHVDGESDFEGTQTPFSISVSDADNIDRFDAYRIYESLQYDKFSEINLQEKKEYVTNKLDRIDKLMDISLGTSTAKELWVSKLKFQKEFFEKLQSQLEYSTEISFDL